MEHYKNFDSRIRTINKENGGLSSARNAGVAVAAGDYLLFLDSDDWLSSNAVEHLYNNAKKNNSDIVIFDFVFDNCRKKNKQIITIEKYKNKYENNPFNVNTTEPFAYKYIPVSVWTKMYRTALIKENNITFYNDMIYEDLPFWAEVSSKAQRITYISEPLISYSVSRDGSIMTKNGRQVFDIIKAYDRVEKSLKEAGCWENYKPAVQLLMVRDFLSKYNIIRSDLKEEYFNAIKSLNKNIENVLYEEDNFSQIERHCIERLKLLNTLDYKAFAKLISR